MRIRLRNLIPILILLSLLLSVNRSRAEDVCTGEQDCDAKKAAKQQELEQKQKDKELTEKQKGSIVGTLNAVGTQLDTVNGQLTQKKKEILSLADEIKQNEKAKEEELARRNTLLRAWYKRYRITPIELFLSAGNFSEFAQLLSGYKATVLQGEREINLLNLKVANLNDSLSSEQQRKQKLEGEVKALATKRDTLSSEKKQVESVLANITSQITNLETTIAGITARQDELLRQKLSATAYFTSVGDTEQARQTLPDPPFSPAFAIVSIGYPHRVGMSQYGALGRAKAGQGVETILSAYYQNFSLKRDYPVPASIEVEGYGRIPFEENYLFGIAEMPTKWADQGGYEALKAQAIAARSYALAYTNNGSSSICTTQWCQVYNSGKVSDGSAERWRQAVKETRGWVMVDGSGSPIKAYYASTAGGYTRLPTDFDVSWNFSASSLKRIHDADSEGRAYDGPSYGNSPWYYRAWYDSATDGHPWLTKDEMIDLLNASLLPDSYNQYLSNESNGGWSKDQVREAARKEGASPIDDLSGLQPIFADEGYTMILKVTTPGGTREIDGKRFRKVFTLRSRGHLALWSSLYDIIKR